MYIQNYILAEMILRKSKQDFNKRKFKLKFNMKFKKYHLDRSQSLFLIPRGLCNEQEYPQTENIAKWLAKQPFSANEGIIWLENKHKYKFLNNM